MDTFAGFIIFLSYIGFIALIVLWLVLNAVLISLIVAVRWYVKILCIVCFLFTGYSIIPVGDYFKTHVTVLELHHAEKLWEYRHSLYEESLK